MSTLDKIKESMLEFEEMSKDFLTFGSGVHSFLHRLKDTEVVDRYAVTFSDNDSMFVSILLMNGDLFEDSFNYSKENYNVSTK